MNSKPLKVIAAVCVFVALLLMLFLPFISLIGVKVGLNGIQIMHFSQWIILPIVTSFIMILVCLFVENRLVGTLVLAAGSFIPLITVGLVKSSSTNVILSFISQNTSLGVSSFANSIISVMLTSGLGVILYLLLGLASAVLFFLNDSTITTYSSPKYHNRSRNRSDW